MPDLDPPGDEPGGEPDFDVRVVNRYRREAVTDDGDVCRITNLIDADGLDTDEPDRAVVAVAECPRGWVVIDLTQFEPATSH